MFKVYTKYNFSKIPQLEKHPEVIRDIQIISQVLPFRVNSYVIDELIDWEDFLQDPMFHLVFPNKAMLAENHYHQVASLIDRQASNEEIENTAQEIRRQLNPHPGDQMTLNIPFLKGQQVPGMQHKYRETVLFFPAHGQYCHSYCTFCFRWAQFVGEKDLLIASKNISQLIQYLKEHKEVTDLLLTGGDPMVMRTDLIREYLAPIIEDPSLSHIRNIRIGTKSLTYWPQRYISDPDADDLLVLFDKTIQSGRHLSIMAHYNHWKELEPPLAKEAVRRIRSTGANIRSQAPVLAHINDHPEIWSQLWESQVNLGIIPYYMFVERDTGPKNYFEVPLEKVLDIYRNAIKNVGGLARSARGPSMSTTFGKIEVQGIVEIQGEKVFLLRFLQARNPEWAYKPFFAAYSSTATWFSQLKPAFNAEKFFFEV